MEGQHYYSQPSQETIRYCLASSGNLVLIKRQGFSTDPQGLLLVPDVGIPGNSWNSSPFLSTMQQHGFCSPTVDCMNTIVNMYNPILGPSPKHHLTLPSNETAFANELRRPFMNLSSLPGTFSRPHAQDKVPDGHFAMEVNSVPADDWPLGVTFPRFDTETPQFHYRMMNESQAITDKITDTVNKSSDRQHSIIDAQFPIMPFYAKPFPNDFSSSPPSSKCSISGSTRGPSMFQEENQAPRTHNEDEHLVNFVPNPPLQCTPRYRGTSEEETAKEMHQCSSCCVTFSQRQGLLRHNKDKHEAKKRCDFCEEFTWPRGRRYVYQRHIQEVHRGAVSPSMRATPMARKKRRQV